MEEEDVWDKVYWFQKKSKKMNKSKYFALLVDSFKDPSMGEVIGCLFDADFFIDLSYIPIIVSKIREICENHDIEDLFILFEMEIFSWNDFLSTEDLTSFFQDPKFDFITLFCEVNDYYRKGKLQKHLAEIGLYGMTDFYHRLQYDLPEFHEHLKTRMFADVLRK